MNRMVRAAIVRKIKMKSPFRIFLPFILDARYSVSSSVGSLAGIISIFWDGLLPESSPEFISRYLDIDRPFAVVSHVGSEKLFAREGSSPTVLSRLL